MRAFRFVVLIVAALLVGASTVWAISLDDAKAKGLVGEAPSGYLGAVGSPSGEVQALIKDINAKRRERYAAIAQRNGTPISAVEALAGKKAMSETPSGEFIQQNGSWVKK